MYSEEECARDIFKSLEAIEKDFQEYLSLGIKRAHLAKIDELMLTAKECNQNRDFEGVIKAGKELINQYPYFKEKVLDGSAFE